MKFIGEKKIKGTLDLPEGRIQVMFKDNTDVEMNKNLFKLIAHNEKREGGIVDRVRMLLATKFLTEMAEYGLDFYMVNNLADGMRTLAHNLREEKISKAFGCAGTDDIGIKTLLEQDK